ncbi:MAG: hypothetical protein LUC93_17425 [Planctomycetaceae bacterium]|nr:hypothetical protein [Planctomycetaceae bacterium]
MFRKPMRLEKWIAFDGAVAVDAVQAVATADDAVDPVDHDVDDTDGDNDAFDSHTDQDSDDADETNDNDDIESYAVMALSDEINDPFKDEFDIHYTKDDGTTATATGKFEIPDTISTSGKDLDDGFFAFRDGAVFQSGTGSNNMAQGQDFFFEIAPPDDGEFFFYDWADIQGDQAGFIAKHGLSNNDYVVFAGATDPVTGVTELVFKQVNGGSLNDVSATDPVGGWTRTGSDGQLYFTITGNGWTTHGNGVINAVLGSVAFKGEAGKAPTEVTGYTISAFHEDGIRNDGTDKLVHFTDDDNGVYREDNAPLSEVGLLPDPGGDGDGDDDIRPPNPPNPGTGDGDDSGGDDGDDSGDGDEGDDPVLTYQEPEAIFDNTTDDDGDYEEARDDGEPDVVVELETAAEDGVDSAAAAMAAELMHEVEILLSSVQGDREVLLQSLTALQVEYLRRGFGHEGAIRDFLRELFERGDREKGAVNRVIGEMRRQLGAFNLLTADQRDGMLVESLRELIEGAERRSGEMGALSRAMEAVVKQMGEWHDRGIEPDAAQARAVFTRVYSEAMAEWQEKAERLDPMGRELITASR